VTVCDLPETARLGCALGVALTLTSVDLTYIKRKFNKTAVEAVGLENVEDSGKSLRVGHLRALNTLFIREFQCA
jgi:hypothetical protein